MWQPGEVVAWRGIFRCRVWHVQPTIVVKDSPAEIVLALLPGTECIAQEDYPARKQTGRRRWHFKDRDWQLAHYTWRTNRLLLILEPERFYSTILFWNHASGEFLCYYINFQLPFEKNHQNLDTLDLDLDLIVNPDFSIAWKDEADYQQAILHQVMPLDWVRAIEASKPDVVERIEKRQYPFDGTWLDWRPDPTWAPPSLPENWDKI